MRRFSVSEGDEFSVTFIHSVNQYPLTDVYEIRDHRIYVVRTIYNNFGSRSPDRDRRGAEAGIMGKTEK